MNNKIWQVLLFSSICQIFFAVEKQAELSTYQVHQLLDGAFAIVRDKAALNSLILFYYDPIRRNGFDSDLFVHRGNVPAEFKSIYFDDIAYDAHTYLKIYGLSEKTQFMSEGLIFEKTKERSLRFTTYYNDCFNINKVSPPETMGELLELHKSDIAKDIAKLRTLKIINLAKQIEALDRLMFGSCIKTNIASFFVDDIMAFKSYYCTMSNYLGSPTPMLSKHTHFKLSPDGIQPKKKSIQINDNKFIKSLREEAIRPAQQNKKQACCIIF